MESEYVKHRERGSCWHIFGLCEKLSDMLNIVQYCLNINLGENRALIMGENEAYSDSTNRVCSGRSARLSAHMKGKHVHVES